MPRGYRLFVVAAFVAFAAAVALAIILQPQQPNFSGDRGYQEQPASYRAGGSGCEPAKVRALPVGLRESKANSCAEAEEQHREAADNLIENRRSAVAAEAGAVAAAVQARIEAVGAGIGILTLFAAIAAAIFAERAAFHTKSSAIEAKRAADTAETALEKTTEVSQTDLRAWVTIDLDLMDCGRSDASIGLTTNVRLKNIGNTPALRIAVSLKAYIRSSMVVGEIDRAELVKFPSPLFPLMPQQEFQQKRAVFIKQREIEESLPDAKKGHSEPMIVVDAVVYYHTVFDKEDAPKRLTSVQYSMHYTFDVQSRQERRDWLDERGPVSGDATFNRNMSALLHLT